MFAARGVASETYTCPDWYGLGVAAKYWGVPPWEMAEQSIYWKDKAIIAQSAEHSARKQLQAMGM